MLFLGTKQETQLNDDELFVSYVSESDLMSDSVSIFSDMNMSDSSGTFIFDPVSSTTVPSKKKSTQQSVNLKKQEPPSSNAKSKSLLHPSSGVVVAQRLDTPAEVRHCSIVKDIFPSLDRSHMIVIVEAAPGQERGGICGAILVYDIVVEGETVLLEKLPRVLRKIEDREGLIVSCCLIPPDVEEMTMLACVLSRGDVAILSLSQLQVMHRISRPSPDAVITSVSYCASKLKLSELSFSFDVVTAQTT